MNVAWLLLLTLEILRPPTGVSSQSNNKCLDIPEVLPKKYFHLNSKSLYIKLETSSRVTHQLATHVFYIFIKEVLGYSKIEVSYYEDNFQIESVIERLSDYSNTDVTEPPATINLEVWVSPDYDTFATELIKECGAISPPGRFGWFIPTELDYPIRKYYDRLIWNATIQEVHWSLFIDRKLVRNFDIDAGTLRKLIEDNKYNRVNGGGQYVCSNATICHKSMYTPRQCVNQSCAVLLAPQYNASSFLVDHVNEMNLFVKVLWLGDNLRAVVDTLKLMYLGEYPTKSLVIFNWFPSHVILQERDYYSVQFKNNELFNFTHNREIGYKYEMHRLVKLAWGKVEKNAAPLYFGLRSFKFEAEDYQYLLGLYKDGFPDKNISDMACEWMQNNEKIWSQWKTSTESTIYIGGIFPMTMSSYNGRGIYVGASLATQAINSNRMILPDYRLQLLGTDGKCLPDNVMKNFIDFIVEGYYMNLVGVLGPACSDTVEPLAGVSKHYHIMVISYSAEGASFSDRKKYPYFFRTIGENQHYKNVYLYLFKQFGWKRLAALTEDGQKYTEYISLMQDDLERNNVKLIANKKFPRERESDAMTRYLQDLKNKRARIIIADVVDDVARTVMCEAYKLKMTAKDGYVWFLPTWLHPTWYNASYFRQYMNESINCTTEEMISAITGYFSMTHAYFAPDDAIMQENITVGKWKENYKKRTKYYSDYAGFAYDAVWTYALALDKLAKTDPEALSDLHSEDTTNKLVSLVEQTDFYGVSGRIKFRGGPSRFSVINVMQWYDNATHLVGHFFPNLTDDRPVILGGHLKLNSSAIRWYTEDGQVPEDGTVPPTTCPVESFANLFNVECQTAMIILNVIVVTVLLIGVVIVFILVKRKYDRQMKFTENYMKNLGLPLDMTMGLDKWEIHRQCVVINRKIGEGAFGTVYGGEANLPSKGWTAVAVKTLKVGSTTEEKLDFLSEAEVMKRFDHKNVIKLLAVCTKEEPVYTIMEFMLYGDLKTYLLARRHLVQDKNVDESEEVSPKRLTNMALDVARGLSYLADKKYVHRDIASRNCLVNAQRCVKLGDFGMTRSMFESDYYKFTRRGMLPVRWMAPESLELGVFTTNTDVWSFGVLLYEIITFGSFPFQGKSNAQVLELVKKGHCLDIPKGVKTNLEAIIKSCWAREPSSRPKPSLLVEFLANNPRLLVPCLDIPLSSVQMEEEQVQIPPASPTIRASPPKLTVEATVETLARKRPKSVCESESIPLEVCSQKEPLLGGARSASNLLNIGRLVNRRESDDEDDMQDTSNEQENTIV